MSPKLVQKAHDIEAILAAPANKQRGNCRMEERNDLRRRKRSTERRSKH
jgi:hypothetical protein